MKAAERPLVRNVTFYVMSSNDEAGLAAGQYWTSLSVGVGAIHTYITYITCITYKPHSHCIR